MTVLGTLTNAPLACVLIAIQFEELPEFKEKLERIKSPLLKVLPRFRHTKETIIAVPTTESLSVDVYEFLSEEGDHALKIVHNQISLIVTSYKRSTDFIQLFGELLSVVWTELTPLVTRIGVRYIDFILPSSGELPEEYVQGSVHGVMDLKIGQLETFEAHLTQYMFANGAMTIRYATCIGAPQLPPELGLVNMRPSEIMQRSHNGKAAVLDFDRFGPFVKRLSQQELIECISQYQQDLSKAFKAIISEKAKAAWS